MELTLENTAQQDLRILHTREVEKIRNAALRAQQQKEADAILSVPGYGVEIRKS